MEKPIQNVPLTENELQIISQLSELDVAFIDESILSSTKNKFLKQARIIIEAKEKVDKKLNNIPLTYY